MQYRRAGNSGLQISAISLGAWATFGETLDEEGAVDLMVTAYDHGVNFFDNAGVYGAGASENMMGRALRRLAFPRGSFLVASKVFWGTGSEQRPNMWGLSRKHIFEECHAALARLSVDHLDIYFCHRFDPATLLEETVRAMSDLVTQGKVLYWGTSEWSAQEILEARSIASQHSLVAPIIEQPKYNCLHRARVEQEYLRLLQSGMGAAVWSPLASGLLTGRYNEGFPPDGRLSRPTYKWVLERALPDGVEQGMDLVRRWSAFAAELGTSPGRLAIAWCLRNPHVSTVITGASTSAQFRDSAQALEIAPLLTSDVLERLDTMLGNRPVPPKPA